MPVEFPGYDERAPTRDLLQKYVIAVRDFLAEIIGHPENFYERLREAMQAAWQEVRSEFERLTGAIQSLSDERIRDHGLYGSQLQFKLEAVRHGHERYTQRGRGFLRQFIDIIETLLDSIIDATGVGGPIREFKEYLGHSVEEPA
jgi:hypothetical protein